MKECPSCNHSNPEGNSFCVNCGTSLVNNAPAPAPTPTEPVAPVAAPLINSNQPIANPEPTIQPISNPEPSVQTPAVAPAPAPAPEEDSNLVPENQVLNSGEKKVTGDKTNKNAVLSLSFSIAGFFISWLLSLAGLSIGLTALNQLKTTNEKGRGLAIAGVVIGGLGVGLVFLGNFLKNGS